jgi:hypothetical protein
VISKGELMNPIGNKKEVGEADAAANTKAGEKEAPAQWIAPRPSAEVSKSRGGGSPHGKITSP